MSNQVGNTTTTQLDPRKLTISEFSKYKSNEIIKLAASFRTYKKSALYIGGTLILSLFSLNYFNKKAHEFVFGQDNRGGNYLNMRTFYDEDHYTYNREFQRQHVLGEAKIGDLPVHSTQLIRDLGGKVPELGAPHIAKRPPHEKFY